MEAKTIHDCFGEAHLLLNTFGCISFLSVLVWDVIHNAEHANSHNLDISESSIERLYENHELECLFLMVLKPQVFFPP